MAKTTLPTDFQDDVLNASMNGKRRYNEVTNDDGTFSLEDVTAYDTVGSDFGASTVNEMNRNINESFDAGKIIKSMSTLTSTTVSGYVPDALLLKTLNNSLGGLSFAQDDEGNWGYKPSGADAVIPFSGEATCSEALFERVSTSTRVCRIIDESGILAAGTGTTTYSGNKISSSISSNVVTYTALASGYYLLCQAIGTASGNIAIKKCATGEEIYTFTRASTEVYSFVGFMG